MGNFPLTLDLVHIKLQNLRRINKGRCKGVIELLSKHLCRLRVLSDTCIRFYSIEKHIVLARRRKNT